jgi:hypothetical protein
MSDTQKVSGLIPGENTNDDKYGNYTIYAIYEKS